MYEKSERTVRNSEKYEKKWDVWEKVRGVWGKVRGVRISEKWEKEKCEQKWDT